MTRSWPTISGVAPAVAAFLEPSHTETAARVMAWSEEHLLERPEPADDTAARGDARALLQAIGAAGWLRGIAEQDLRAVCIVREIIAAMSPLAGVHQAASGCCSRKLRMRGTRTSCLSSST